MDQVSSVVHEPTFAVMLTFPKSLCLDFAACQIENHPAVMFLSCDSSKPVRTTWTASHGCLAACTGSTECARLALQGRARSDGQECWVALAVPEFARSLLEKKPVSVDGKYNPQTQEYLQSLLPTMLDEVLRLLSDLGAEDAPEPCFSAMQRWGAGFVSNPIGLPVLSSTGENFVACGDFCLGSTFEDAVISGMHAATEVHDAFATRRTASSRL